jgi:hypothetical protein
MITKHQEDADRPTSIIWLGTSRLTSLINQGFE